MLLVSVVLTVCRHLNTWYLKFKTKRTYIEFETSHKLHNYVGWWVILYLYNLFLLGYLLFWFLCVFLGPMLKLLFLVLWLWLVFC
jgi:hypothetical protein